MLIASISPCSFLFADESVEKNQNDVSNKDQTKRKRNILPKRKNKHTVKHKCTSQPKPCFPDKKRVRVTPYAANETPVRPEKVLKLSEPIDEERDEGNKLAPNSQKSQSLRPFFWLREGGEEEEEEIEDFVSLSNITPLNAPCFSDLKDSHDDVPFDTTPIVS